MVTGTSTYQELFQGLLAERVSAGGEDSLVSVVKLTTDSVSSVNQINTLIPGAYDYVSLSYTGQNLTGAVFKQGGSGVVSTGTISAGYAYVEVPVNAEVDSWTVLAGVTGSIVTNIYRSTYSGFPPTSLLPGLGQPLLTNLRKNTGNATGTVSISKGDILQLEVSSASTVKLVTVALQCRNITTS
jgi:hypothetical protein